MIGELFLPVAVLGILASMILPIPPFAMDFLIGSNLILALVLLLSTLSIKDHLKLSSLPSLLLLATLFRLSLNIATTRNILSHGVAGEIVDAFGTIVVSGNLIVGVVIFLIITLVQFIVVAKGVERVAEVSARFTLDALPGKQMSIDADLRSGLIDLATARERRQDLQTESRFLGALDGAMKFVKGDAIAGMVVTAINFVGGLAIGIILEGLDPTQAMSRYSLLTIGDGLSAQIPSLLNSFAAGIVVTRVSRGDNTSLATDLVGQLLQQRSVKVIIGVVAIFIAMVPAMPTLPFIVLAAMLLFSARRESAEVTAAQNQAAAVTFAPCPPALITVQFHASRVASDVQTIARLNEGIRRKMFETTGLVLPTLEFLPSKDTDQDLLTVLLRGIVTAQVQVAQKDFEIEAQRQIVAILNERAGDLVDDRMTRRVLDAFDAVAPEMVSAIVPGVVSVTQLTEILRPLVTEGISVKSFDLVLQTVSEFGPKAASERVLLEEVRIALKRVICEPFVKKGKALRVLTICPLTDAALSKAERDRQPLDPELLTLLVEFLGKAVGVEHDALLAGRGARRLLRTLALTQGLSVPTLAQEEIVTELKLEVAEIFSPRTQLLEPMLDRLAA